MSADKRQLSRIVSRMITRIDLNPFDDGRGGKATNPIITLDDGAQIGFSVQETETGEYGIEINYFRAGLGKKKGARS
jgi:hypothetical protein